MTTYTLGANCHITIQHDLVNAGAPFGFILNNDAPHAPEGPAVSIQKQVDSDGTIITRVFFSLLLSDHIVDPDGSIHPDARAAMYAMLLLFLMKDSHITLTCPAGVISNLCSLGHVSTEYHYGDHSIVVCQLTTLATYYPPADPTAYNLSVWDGALLWSTSYWRNIIPTPPPAIP